MESIRELVCSVHHMDSKYCFLSHYSLWKKCVELKEPIMILEHDVEFNDKVIIPKEFGDWDGVINIGQPIWGTCVKNFESEELRMEIRDKVIVKNQETIWYL